MKRNVVVITNYGDSLSHEATEGKSRPPQSTFDVLSLGLDDIDLAIVDLGANLQSLAIVEALTHSEPAPPVIALVDGKDPEAIAELHRHGATACLTKPFCADALARLIKVVCASASHEEAPS